MLAPFILGLLIGGFVVWLFMRDAVKEAEAEAARCRYAEARALSELQVALNLKNPRTQ